MPEPDRVLVGIDVGTSGVRVEVYSVEGDLLAAGKSPLKEQSPEAWLSALRAAAPPYLRGCACEKHVVVDGTSGTFVLVGPDGRVLSGPHMYYDKDVQSYELAKVLLPADVANAVQLSAESPLVKLFGIRRARPEVWAQARWVMPQATWLSYMLCGRVEGRPATDYSNALKFGLDVSRSPPSFVAEAYEMLDLDLDKMPSLVPSGTPLCRAEGQLAQDVGLEGATVYNGMTDGNASALAGGAVERGDATVYTGSTTVVKAVSDRMVPHPSIYYHVHPISGYLAGGATGFTGAFLSWLSEKVMGVRVEEAIGYAERSSGQPPVFFPPADRSPFYVPDAFASLINIQPDPGESRENAVGRVIAGVLAGITYLERWFLDLFESVLGIKVTAVGVTGGTSRSDFWNRLRANVYGRRVLVYGDAVAKGALVPVLVGEGFGMSVREVKVVFLRPLGEFAPQEPGRGEESLTKYMDAWAKVVETVSQLKS